MKKLTRFTTSFIFFLWLTQPLLMLSQETMLLRQPTISATDIVFVHANDLWRVSRDGGKAIRLTSNLGGETSPHFSNDGRWIAFTGQYDGNADVYIIPSEGGEPKRLTYHPGNDEVSGWTPDGQVLFASSRAGVPTKESQFYTISPEGGHPKALPIPRGVNGELSADGRYMAYQQIGFWDPEWRNHRGGQAKPIWIVDMRNFELQMTPQPDNERHTSPVWHNGEVYFLSERDFANNIWKYNPSTKQLKQITFHSDFDVKNLDAGGGAIVYEQGGRLHLLNMETEISEPLSIEVAGDMNWAKPRWVEASAGQLNNPQISPTGKRAIFEFRGDIFTIPKEDGPWRNLTNSSDAADRSPVWSPSGEQIAWFSDQSGEYQLLISDQKGLEAPKVIDLPDPTFYFKPVWSPDGKYIAYTDTNYTLWYIDVESGVATQVESDRFAHPNRTLNPVWSPDSRWIAYVKLQPNQFKVIKVFDVQNQSIHQLTDDMADAIAPVWDAGGKHLYFLASTDYGLASGWLDMSSYDASVTRRPYVLLLDAEEPSPFLPISDEEAGSEEKSENEEEIKVAIDFEGVYDRAIPVNVPNRNYTDMMPGPKGYFFFTEVIPNEGTQLHRYHVKESKKEVFLPTITTGVVSSDRKQLLYRSGSTWGIVATSGGPQKVGDGRLNLSGIRVKVNPKEEAHQIFREGWRYMRDFLYVDNTHGAPWDKVYEWYSPWIDHVRHRSDLNYVVDIMSGEIAVGHSYVSGGDYPSLTSDRVGLLGADIAQTSGGFRLGKIYTAERWNPNLRAPLATAGAVAKEGEYVVAVNGTAIDTKDNFYSYFLGLANQQITLSLNDQPTLEGAREMVVQTVSNEGGLRNTAWIEGNRRRVDELSNGQLAYVYVPNTGNGGFTSFNRYYFPQQDKKGAIIDERNNGGGSAADYMVDVMSRKLHGYFNSRVAGNTPFPSPGAGIWGPKVMLINERAGSGGDLLPYMFKKMEIGPLIGTRTWGGLVGTWDTPPFIDNGRMVAPRGGFFNTDGEWDVEGIGVSPDVPVEQLPKLVISGRDPQLERAVEVALGLLETEGIELKSEPDAPIRYKRPKKGNR